MRRDIIKEIAPKEVKKIRHIRVAEGEVNGVNLRLELNTSNVDKYNYRVESMVNSKYDYIYFKNKFKANLYFKRMMRKYKLKEVDLMVDAL